MIAQAAAGFAYGIAAAIILHHSTLAVNEYDAP